MIVKNEEDWIEGCLESVRSIVDEVIIADTGSTDRTLSLISRFNPKVFRYQWNDHFADARNASLAAATCPWVLILDADERIAARDLPKVVEATRQSSDGYHLIQRNYVSGSQVFGWTANSGEYPEGDPYPGYVDNPLIRLFRNTPELRFHGAVHEIIDPNRLPATYRFGTTSIVIHHYGKVCQRERLAAKQRFYLDLGLKKIQEDPSNAKARFDLGIQYQELGRHADARQWFEQTFEMTGEPLALLYWAISEKHEKKYSRAVGLLNQAIALGLDTCDVHLELGNIYLAIGELRGAYNEYKHCLKLNPRNPVVVFNCGLALKKLGDLREASKFYQRAIDLDRTFREPAFELANIRAANNQFAEAIRLLKPIVDNDSDFREARLTLAKVYIQANSPDDAIRLLQAFPPADAIAQCLLGAAHLQKNNLDDAQKHLEAALRRDRSLIDARINLARVYTQKGDHARAARYAQSVAIS